MKKTYDKIIENQRVINSIVEKAEEKLEGGAINDASLNQYQ